MICDYSRPSRAELQPWRAGSSCFRPAIRIHRPSRKSSGWADAECHDVSRRVVGRGDAEFVLIWTTPTVPADNNNDADGATREAGLTLHGGSVIRVVDIDPRRRLANASL